MLTRDREKKDRLQQKLWREFDSPITQWLEDNNIVEVMLNPDGNLWFQHRKKGLVYSGDRMSDVQAMNLIGTIAALNDAVINEAHPILECKLPFLDHRVEALIPPIVESPTFCIRKRAIQIYTLDNYVEQGVINEEQVNVLRQAILEQKTILIVGGPGTGKTTFANALLHAMTALTTQHERILILEDTRELQSTVPNTVFLQTSDNTNFQQLLRAALRLRPDKICMGECRGSEMLTLLKCWNTGTPGGLATLHANSAKSALIRIQEMVAESGSYPQPQLIAESVNVIISIAFDPTRGRVVNEILEVIGYQNQDFQLQPLLKGSPPCSSQTLLYG